MSRMPYSASFYQQAAELIGVLAEKLMAREYTLGTAESCTGGLLAAMCTEVPGSSAWFGGGLVTYANSWKQSLLAVEESVLVRHGAVSGEVVKAMAAGLVSRYGVQAGISISGIAGPGGGSLEKPVGTVWIGVAFADREAREKARIRAGHHIFSGSRQDVRSAAVLEALRMAGDMLHSATNSRRG